MEVEDLFTDLADGIKLLKLLEIISGEKPGKPKNGKMRIFSVENVNKSLAFLQTKARCLQLACLLSVSHSGAAEGSGLLGCDAV